MKSFYITTPIYYVNDRPHAGTAYSTVLADVLSRWRKFFGEKTFFLTGVDEHGQKCQQSALAKGLKPQEHCDQMSGVFKKSWAALDIQYDCFYRTTSAEHKKRVSRALQKLFDTGYIYQASYEGWYSVSEEIFYTQKDLSPDGLSPQGKEVIKIKEKNYFFKMSKFRKRLIHHLETHPHFISPPHRQNEVMGFLKQGLDDLCISRPKKRLEWGIELPFDKDYVAYVWVDALLNYVFGAGLWGKDQEKEFNFWWKEAVHLIGKDILITHAVYWPCLLMALEIDLPKQILSHGWLLNKDQEKMSKSKGDIINPMDLIPVIGSDSLRYFFIKSARLGQDAPISVDIIIQEHNQDLANTLGNLLQRAIALIESHFDSKLPAVLKIEDAQSTALKNLALNTCDKVREKVLSSNLNLAAADIMELCQAANKYLEQETPWKLVKTNKERAGLVLRTVMETARIAVCLLQPVLPKAGSKILEKMEITNPDFKQTKQWNILKTNLTVKKESPVFPRVS